MENKVADALSRKPSQEADMLHAPHLTHSSKAPAWMNSIIESYEEDIRAFELLKLLAVDPNAAPRDKLQNGILLYKDKKFVGLHTSLK